MSIYELRHFSKSHLPIVCFLHPHLNIIISLGFHRQYRTGVTSNEANNQLRLLDSSSDTTPEITLVKHGSGGYEEEKTKNIQQGVFKVRYPPRYTSELALIARDSPFSRGYWRLKFGTQHGLQFLGWT